MAQTEKENQLILFTPIISGTIPAKDQQDLMTYPFFSLSKGKRVKSINYDDGRVKVVVSGQEEHGIANIYDADILIYLASQIIEAKNKGLDTSRRIKMSRYDILEFLGKGKGGSEYNRLKESLDRLQSTSISMTIRREDSHYKHRAMFSWINDWQAVEKKSRPVALEIELNEWLYKGILDDKILTLPHKYFRIEGGLERFLYKLCRKVVGTERGGELQMKIETVHSRSGLTRKPGAFKKMLEKIVEEQSIPDYWIVLAQRVATGDWYVCGYDRKFVDDPKEAMERVSFIALDKALIENRKGT